MTEILDTQVLDELLALCDGGDPELLLDLVDMFLTDVPSKVTSILEGMAAQDFTKVEHAAHALKGTSGSLGATHVMRECEAIQNACRSREHASIPTHVDQLRKNLADADGALRAFIAQLS